MKALHFWLVTCPSHRGWGAFFLSTQGGSYHDERTPQILHPQDGPEIIRLASNFEQRITSCR